MRNSIFLYWAEGLPTYFSLLWKIVLVIFQSGIFFLAYFSEIMAPILLNFILWVLDTFNLSCCRSAMGAGYWRLTDLRQVNSLHILFFFNLFCWWLVICKGEEAVELERCIFPSESEGGTKRSSFCWSLPNYFSIVSLPFVLLVQYRDVRCFRSRPQK